MSYGIMLLDVVHDALKQSDTVDDLKTVVEDGDVMLQAEISGESYIVSAIPTHELEYVGEEGSVLSFGELIETAPSEALELLGENVPETVEG